jgi:hypothetical protein
MLFIWGSYARTRVLHESGICSRCKEEREIEFVRTWKTGHLFFVPLFSHSHDVLSRCETCGREGVAYPRHLPPLPFMDRLGFVAAFAVLFLLVVAASASSASRTPSAHSTTTTSATATAAKELRQDLQIGIRDPSAEEKTVVDAVSAVLQRSYDNFGKIDVGARVRARDAHKTAFVIVQLENLQQNDDDIRRDLLHDVHRALAGVLEANDEAVVGIRGGRSHGAYSALGIGPLTGATWRTEKVGIDLTRELDLAIGAAL